jgi:suppressor for copper-sensitivity B
MLNIVRSIKYAFVCVCLFQAVTAHAASESSGRAASPWFDTEYASVRLISATNSVGKTDAQQPLTMGLEFQLQDGWKIYWRSPGDAGYPPRANWSGSSNIWAIDMRWPAPVRFSVLGFETLGYKHEVVFPLTITPLQPGEAVSLGGQIDYLICSEICVPETLALSLEIPAGSGEPSKYMHRINQFDVQVPGDGSGSGLRIEALELLQQADQDPELVISASTADGLPFTHPDAYLEGPLDNPGTMGFGKPVILMDTDGQTATFRVPVVGTKGAAGNLLGKDFTVTLVDGVRSAEYTTQVTALDAQSITQLEDHPSSVSSPMGIILLFAFLGGLILNLMPCVLPVLSIKLLGVIGHGGGHPRQVRISFMASAAGIVTSFMIIAGALAALKSSGVAIGWGVQFQQPLFLVAMALIITVFSCNLWGWFEFHTPALASNAGREAPGIGGHFMTGMLATLLATPCSAPFLGTAVGFALARGTMEILTIFLVLGLGLAAPYLLVAALPRLATMLPKPGNWMIVLRKILGFALAGTVLWLLSVLAVQIGMLPSVAISACLIMTGVVFYLRHRGLMAGKLAVVAVLASGLFAMGLPYVVGPPRSGVMAEKSSAIDKLWQPFDASTIDDQVAQGKTVFVDVTAEWCVSCLVNKTFVLARGDVFERLSAGNVIPMQADWTLPKASITHYLATFQRYGIPFNAVYGPGAPNGIVLPEILTPDVVIEALGAAKG